MSVAFPTQPTLDEWLALTPVQVLHTSEALLSHNVQVYLAKINPTPNYYPGPKTDDDFIVMLLQGRNFIESNVKDATGYMSVGSMQILSRSMDYTARWNATSKVAIIQIPRTITNDLITTWGQGDPEKVEIPFAFNHRDPLLSQLGHTLVQHVQSPSPNGLYAESLLYAMTVHLLYEYRKTPRPHPTTGKLTPQQKRIVEDYIYEHLEQNFSIADLATAVHLSASHFQKIFRATFQCSPHHYVLERQIERAKILLLTTPQSLNEVAFACGFANQSHFTRHFKAIVGVTPGHFARHVR